MTQWPNAIIWFKSLPKSTCNTSFVGNNQPPWRILFLKEKKRKAWKNPPQLSFQTNLAWASEVPGQQPWITGWYHWFSWWLSKNHESCRRFHNCLYLPCENEASISARHIWGEPNYCKDFKLEHDMNSPISIKALVDQTKESCLNTPLQGIAGGAWPNTQRLALAKWVDIPAWKMQLNIHFS